MFVVFNGQISEENHKTLWPSMDTEFYTQSMQQTGYVHDMSLDHYGRRMATCSDDGTVRVFAKEKQGWRMTNELKEHNGPVTHCTWAHPEFSQLLAASSSEDKRVSVWEEDAEGKFKRLASLEINSSIEALEFAPKHCGLMLAVGTGDGMIRLFRPSADKTNWVVNESFRNMMESSMFDVSSLSWNSFPYDHPSMVVGSIQGKCASVWTYRPEHKQWNLAGTLHSAGPVNHVAWAPNLGRSFHLIATASSDGTAKIWSVKSPSHTTPSEGNESILFDPTMVECALVQNLDHSSKQVYRVEWNITGTILATSCDDRLVRFWSPNFKGEWTEQIVRQRQPQQQTQPPPKQ